MELGEKGLAHVRRQVLQPLGERPEALHASPRIGTGWQRTVGVPGPDAFAPAGVTNAPVRGDLVLAEAVLGSLAGDERARLKMGAQLGGAHDATALDGFV
jgi:hypothetical protein